MLTLDISEEQRKKLNDRLSSLELLGQDYMELPSSALISLRNDRNTSYLTYLEVQDQLQAAINELRNGIAEKKFGLSYEALEQSYEKSPNEWDQERILAVRSVYPLRISEAEPFDSEVRY